MLACTTGARYYIRTMIKMSENPIIEIAKFFLQTSIIGLSDVFILFYPLLALSF